MEVNQRFNYNKKYVRGNLIIGVSAVLIGFVVHLFFSKNGFDDGLMIVGVSHFVQGIYYWKSPYVKIKDGVISKHEFIIKKRQLNEVVSIRKFADEYILKTSDKELIVNHHMMDKKDQDLFVNWIKGFQEQLSQKGEANR